MSAKTLEQKVEQILAEEKIRRLIFDYAFHLDMNHPKEMVELFVEDCTVIYGPNFGAQGRVAYEFQRILQNEHRPSIPSHICNRHVSPSRAPVGPSNETQIGG